MAVGTVLSRVTGVGRLVAMTYALGVAESRLADAYTIANTLPNVLFELVLGGILTSVLVPVVVAELRNHESDDAWRSISELVTAALALLVAVSVVTMVAAPWIVGAFSGRLDGVRAARQQELATFLLRFFAPQIALYGVAALAAGLLNAHDRFAVPMFAPILNNLVVIATFVRFAQLTPADVSDATVTQSEGTLLLLALGTTAGVAAMALAHLPALRALPGRIRLHLDLSSPAVRSLGRLSGWTLGYVVANQVSFGLVLLLANGVQGGPTAFAVAFAFFQLPYGVAAVSIMTALFPRLSAEVAEGDDAAVAATVTTGLRSIALVMLPATAAYLVLAKPVVAAVLERGVMGPESSELVAGVLVMFAVGLLPFSVFLWALRAFYARHDARTPFAVNAVANLAYVVAALVLYRPNGVAGLALAHSISYVVGAGLALAVLSRRVRSLELRALAGPWARVAVAATVCGVVMSIAVDRVDGGSAARVGAAGGAGLVVFLVAARLLRADLDLVRGLRPARRAHPTSWGG